MYSLRKEDGGNENVVGNSPWVSHISACFASKALSFILEYLFKVCLYH